MFTRSNAQAQHTEINWSYTAGREVRAIFTPQLYSCLSYYLFLTQNHQLRVDRSTPALKYGLDAYIAILLER